MSWDEASASPPPTAESQPVSSETHAVLIPTYNTGPTVIKTVTDVLSVWTPVWVIVDGSDDGTAEALEELASSNSDLHLLRHDHNRGKGAAVLTGAIAAREKGLTHVLTMDADGHMLSPTFGNLWSNLSPHPAASSLANHLR